MNVLYKYCDLNGIKILESLELKLPYISDVNDPLECMPFFFCPDDKSAMREQCLRTFERNSINPPVNWENKLNELYETGELRKMLEDGMLDFIRKWNSRNCLLSVSKTAKESVMWAHYAEKHRGVVIGIDFNNIHQVAMKMNTVNYSENRPKINILHEFTRENSEEIALTKSTSWKYEKEFRAVFLFENLEKLQQKGLSCLKDFNDKKTWFLRLNPESIREVIFGLYAEDSLKLAIKNLIKKTELQHIRLYQVKESETYTLGLDNIDI